MYSILLTAVDCGTLEDPVNGMVDATRGTTLGNVATYECDVGYMRVGQLLRVCQTSGLWNGLAPTCICTYVASMYMCVHACMLNEVYYAVYSVGHGDRVPAYVGSGLYT